MHRIVIMARITPEEFNLFLLIMSGIAAIVFVALYFLRAGYGMFRDSRWGISLNNKVAWVLMEAPVFIVMALLWWGSERRFEAAPLVIFRFSSCTISSGRLSFPSS